MKNKDRTKEDLIRELTELQKENNTLEVLKEKREAAFLVAHNELLSQNEKKEQRAAELVIANEELVFQNQEKEKRAAELVIANKELVFQNQQKKQRAAELIIANEELAFQNEEKGKRAAELYLAKEIAEEFENKFKQIAEKIDDVFWLRTDSEMIYVSPSFEKIWGVGVDDIYKNPEIFTEKIHPDDKPFVHEIIHSKEFENKGLFYYEYRVTQPNNQVCWVNSKTFPILDDSGKIIKRAGIARDITDRYQNLQALVKAMEKAEQSDRLKSAFLANMSHEIRTPMNGILGFAELLKEPDLTGDEQQKYIGIIEKSGYRMLNIINQIIDISKIQAGLMELDMKESNMNMQIEYIYTFFKPEAENKKIKLTFKTPLTQKEATIKTDREKVYAIFTNLVKNAIKFTHKGSIEIGYHAKTDIEPVELEFYVKDTGIGIPKNRQKAIFERFIQADIEDRMAYQGAGLGLSISKAYVELLGGKIWVESEEGIGSTFYFTLPYNAKPVKEIIVQQYEHFSKSETISKLNILIVEDDETSEMLIANLIKSIGKVIIKTRTGLEAVEACRANPDIDLILMDIRMSVMGGYEATRQIREFNKEVIIIAQTAYGLSGDRLKSIEAGCNDYISKPINKIELQGLIKKYFGK